MSIKLSNQLNSNKFVVKVRQVALYSSMSTRKFDAVSENQVSERGDVTALFTVLSFVQTSLFSVRG